jgi:hypothetical protein
MNYSPDKNPGVKGIQERFARLGVIGSILRSEEGRERSVCFVKLVTTRTNAALNADMTSFTKMGCHVGVALGTIILVSAQA